MKGMGIACLVVGGAMFLAGGIVESPIDFHLRPYWLTFGGLIVLAGIGLVAVAFYKGDKA